MYKITFDTPIGRLTAVEEDGRLTHLCLPTVRNLPTSALEKQTPLLTQTKREIEEYFKGQRKSFTLPLAPHGTAFQQKVWQALLAVPYGQTLCYGQIARLIGNPKAARAVGMACNQNPLVIVIPCHRIVGKNGQLVGYAGGMAIKQQLLNLEKHGI